MPRRHRRDDSHSPDDFDPSALRTGFRRTEVKRSRVWTVQPISAQAAQKSYRCPGCHGGIEPGVAHVVVWQQDGLMGEAASLEDRRHWHSWCWKVS